MVLLVLTVTYCQQQEQTRAKVPTILWWSVSTFRRIQVEKARNGVEPCVAEGVRWYQRKDNKYLYFNPYVSTCEPIKIHQNR